jgi:gliding motility-associated-like protein
MYQAITNSIGCNQVFAYGESPWGTGTGDSPSIGTNDGAGTTVAQPGGCVAGNVAITRWWGCYPVISGVSANGFVAVAPNAGSDRNVCENTSLSLSGNEPSADAIGTWSVLEAPAGASPTFNSATNKNATVSGLTAYGTYRLGWNINYGGCPSVPDEMTVTRWQAPTVAAAGANQTLSCEGNTATLAANAPVVGVGRWKLVSGSVTVADALSPTTALSNIGYGVNILEWSIGNGVDNPCDSSSSRVQITRYKSTSANAGANQQLVDVTSTTLAANDPVSTVGGSATGLWTQVSGPSNAIFANNLQFNTAVSGLQLGTYVFRWTVSNGNCPVVSSDVTVNIRSSSVPLTNEVYVPNSFSPNGDQKNDEFKVFGNNLKEYKLLIFNRLGNEVAAINFPSSPTTWNGEYKGKLLLGETLLWTLEGTFNDGTEFKKKGSVVVLK